MIVNDAEIDVNELVTRLEQSYWNINTFEYSCKNGSGGGKYIPKYIIDTGIFDTKSNDYSIIIPMLINCYNKLRLYSVLSDKQYNYNSSSIIDHMLL